MQADSLGAIQNPGTSSGRFEVFLYREPYVACQLQWLTPAWIAHLWLALPARDRRGRRHLPLKSKEEVVAEPRGGLPLPRKTSNLVRGCYQTSEVDRQEG
jgi:hypothetical protein